MPLEVVLAVLLGALVHAGWNAAAKSASGGDPLASAAAIAIGGAIVAVPLLLVTGLPSAPSHPYVLASGVVHVLYFVLVGLAYRSADYSAAYPLTRGSAPLFSAILAAWLFAESPGPAGWIGMLLLSAGILGLGWNALSKGSLDRRALAVVALNVAVIAGYTVLDGAGVRLSGNPPGYVLAMMALTGFFMAPVILPWLGRPGLRAMLAAWPTALVGGAMVSLSYGIALWAMTRAPIGMVAALRETSVLFAAILAVVFLKERFGPARWVSAFLILMGLVAMRMS